MVTLYSWNVNGIRAADKKGFGRWLQRTAPDVLAVQETKAHPDQLDATLREIDGYTSYFFSAKRKGYSGTALYTKQDPLAIEPLGLPEFDDEGRTMIVHFPFFTLINCYFPNSQPEGRRLDYKLAFCTAVLDACNRLAGEGKNVVLCGDYNIAHTAIDLKNPQSNEQNPGYLPEEREWMTAYLDAGYTDTFRKLHPGEPDHYTWWSYRFGARERNIGWRIDYFCVSDNFFPSVTSAGIHADVMGSDHCPVSLTLNV
ncbi:exodeoxyribonuclease III [bacterium]|nr:exodeoxyribonuclease III [bacterium]